tara:strand:- start:175 stop:762 length:588 start_codon:yes stop_codon:yes gene_type:complete
MKQVLILTFLLMMLITACSSNITPNTQYYLLNSPSQANKGVVNNENRALVALKLIELPDYLKQPSLVLQLSDHQLHYSHFHIWADPLQVSLAEALSQDLNTIDSHNYYITESTLSTATVKTDIVVKLSAFHVTHQSQAILAGSYWFQHRGMKNQEKKYNFKLLLALEDDGYPHAVDKMRKAVTQLAADIATKLKN